MGLPRGRYFFKTVLLVLLYWAGVRVREGKPKACWKPPKTSVRVSSVYTGCPGLSPAY